jgi:hypothetical protein
MTTEQKRLLEIDLCGRLPYGVKCQLMGMVKDDHEDPPVPLIFQITGMNKQEVVIEGNSEYDIEDVFPLLRPLSDLTKEITQANYNDGKPFVPINEMGGFNLAPSIISGDIAHKIHGGWSTYTEDWPMSVIQKLNEWHFDYRDLIGQGLAVSIHDIETNPY